MAVEIAKDTFSKRVKLLYDSWKVSGNRGAWLQAAQQPASAPMPCCCCCQGNRPELWDGANALAVLVGGTSDDLRYLKSISLHLWLFGYELPGASAAAWRCWGAPHAAALRAPHRTHAKRPAPLPLAVRLLQTRSWCSLTARCTS